MIVKIKEYLIWSTLLYLILIPLLTPYLFWVLNFDLEQYVTWLWSAFLVQLYMGYTTALFVKKMTPFVDRWSGK